MCCDTKEKIAECMYRLMRTKPIRKITVQDIMDLSHMKRQSFYYHFQDVYEVLDYTCVYLLKTKVRCGEDNFIGWYHSVLAAAEKNRFYIKRVLDDVDWNRAAASAKKILYPQVQFYFPDADREYLDFIATSIAYYIMDRVADGKKIDTGLVIHPVLTERNMCLSTPV